MLALADLRVVDRTSGIAGPYATKLLADAGADVVKVEHGDGDPLRRHRGGGLFEYLNASKRGVTGDDDALVRAADVLFVDRAVDCDALWHDNAGLIVVAITPFGLDGPWADRPATELTLQAACGSTGSRGLPERPPLPAGGRFGEWITGTFAAIGALAAARSGRPELVDVAMLDCMTLTMTTYPSVFSSFAGWPPMRGTGRMIEVPSIEPTADGFAVFTTNSAQQFHDFLVMIGRDDLVDDRDLAQVLKRFKRRDEFLAVVHEWTRARSTEEALRDAALFRIPSGPVLNGQTVLDFEQFAARHVFVDAPSGRFRQPGVPYRIDGVTPRPLTPAPALGADDGAVAWPARPARRGDGTRDDAGETRDKASKETSGEWRLPLAGVRVVDCTAWWAGPAATNVLSMLGADVVKVESVTRPDMMRYSATRPPTEERWYEWGPLFHGANLGKRGVTIDLRRSEGVELFERLLRTADVLVENSTPRVMEQFGLTWARVHEVNPDLLMVRMPAFGLDGPWRDRTGFAQTMESVTGMSWLTGFPDGPPVLVRGACDPLAGMHAVVAVLVALAAGGGRLVEATMVEAALAAAAEPLIDFQLHGEVAMRQGAPGVYRCAGDDAWVTIDVTDEAVGAVAAGERELARWCAERDPQVVVDELVAQGIAAEVVIAARDCVHNPQLRHRRLFEVEDHPVTGQHEVPTMPFRFTRVDRWAPRPAPTLGQHNDEVLGEVASAAELATWRATGVVGERVVTG